MKHGVFAFDTPFVFVDIGNRFSYIHLHSPYYGRKREQKKYSHKKTKHFFFSRSVANNAAW